MTQQPGNVPIPDPTLLTKELTDREIKHSNELQELRSKYEREISDLKDKHTREMSDLKDKHRTEVEDRRAALLSTRTLQAVFVVIGAVLIIAGIAVTVMLIVKPT